MVRRGRVEAVTGEETGPVLQAALNAGRKLVLKAAAFSFFTNLLMLTGPLYMLQIYDRVLSSRSYETLAVITLLTVLLFAAMAALDFARGALLARAGEAFEGELKNATFNKAMDAARRGLASADQPLKDLRTVRQFVASPGFAAIFDAPWAPVFLLLVTLMHWVLGLVALVGMGVLLALAGYNEWASRQANAAAQRAGMDAEKLAISALRNVSAADAMGMRGVIRKRWLALNNAASDHAVSATDTTGGLTAASKAIRLFLQSAILGAGAYLAIKSEITPGVMIAASIIAGRALSPIETITSQWRSFAMAGIAYQRLRTFIGAAKEDQVRTSLPAPEGAIDVTKLFCQPAAAKKPVVKSVTFSLARGEALGIVGPSAAGKSTLARAIVGVERAAAGEVRIDGADVSGWNSDDLGRHIGFLPQEVELFGGTAAENIARFFDDAKSEDIIAAAQAAGAHEMILALPEGYDTEIGERGAHLSAGQRQRLGLARALFGNPALVVLDEPNANLDADGEAALAAAVQGLKQRGATTIIVSHRPSAIAYVDKLLLLAEGEVRAFGPRDEILAKIAPRQVAPFKQTNAV